MICSDGRIAIADGERKAMGDWMRAYSYHDSPYKTGLFRDIYPFNFITPVHLQQPVRGSTLEEWVGLDPAHGTLHPLSATQWMWAVEESHIPAVQEVLEKAGLLLCYQPVHFASSAE
jgi:hypothetical protein